MIRKIVSFFFSIMKASRLRYSGDAILALAGSLRALALLAFACAVFCSAATAQNPATSVAVDVNANQHPINPNIYGVAFGKTSDVSTLNAPLNRFGGNNTSDYNWQQDALNLDFDWYFESYLMDGPPIVPGAYYDNNIQATYAANVGSEPMITIPMLPYIAKVGADANSGAASLWSFSIKKYGAQVACDNLAANDPYQSDAGSGCLSGGGYVVNDPTDAYVSNSVAIETGLVQHLVNKWGLSTTATGVKYYILDNEPSLWSSTHRDAHPNPETYDEEYNNIVAYATAIRSVDPNAKIVAPEEWSWWAMYLSGQDQAKGTGSNSDYATHNSTYYYPYLLQKLYAYQQSTGTKLIDVLSVHCYSDASSNFNVATRELWDPNYKDPDWYADSGLNGGILEWIPLMKQWVNQYYPGLEIGCTEYNWGNETSLVGATTQADVEGIYGVYGFDLATRWTVPAQPTYLAMQIYRNYDGNLSTFGDTSVSATVADPDNLSAFAALRSTDGALTVMVINKQAGSTPLTISLANFSSTGTAQAYQVSSPTQTSINSLGSVAIANNSLSTTVPSQSITLFVIPSGSVLTVPTTPTGLAAAVGNGTVTLTWNAGGGATSYSVSRGSSSTGPFTAIGTVTSPAPTTYTDTGLTNGNTYYYVVSGTNSKGTSPNSAPVAAAPLLPPTFTSSATASPSPVTQNASTTITATVKCTANSLTNGTVQIIALDPSGNVALTKSFTAQSFTANQTQTYRGQLTKRKKSYAKAR
ncbi:MAG: glycoside hydrolase family 44 protein [Terracidiphilus sp.]